MAVKGTWDAAKATFSRFMADKAMQMGAALAFYTIFSLAPILLIVTGIAGLVWGEEAVQGQIAEQAEDAVGEDAAQLVETVLRNAADLGQGIIAIVVGLVAAIIGATGVFVQLKDSLNTIWGVKPRPDQGLGKMFRDRLWSFAMVLGIAFLLLVSLVVSSVLSGMAGHMEELLPGPPIVMSTVQFLISLAVITVLFAMIFKYLPDVEVQWRDVWVGAGVTALLFVIGESLVSWYLGQASVASAYGVAGSLVLVLLWIYYSALIFLLGAEFTQVYTERWGSGIKPSEDAMPIDAEPAGESR